MRLLTSDLREKFHARACEWMLAIIMLQLGIVLAPPFDTFAITTSFGELSRIADEKTWAWITATAGGVRVIALTINGAFRPMAHLRVALAIASALVWFQITISILESGVLPSTLAIFPVFVAFEFINAVRAASDAGKADAQAHRGSRNGGV